MTSTFVAGLAHDGIWYLESPRYPAILVVGLMSAAMVAAVLRGTGIATGVPIGIPMFLGIMHFGTLARLADRGDGADATRCFHVGCLMVFLSAGPISAIGFIQNTSDQRLVADGTSLYVSLLLFLSLRRNTVICRPWLLYLGLISYALYLVHPLVPDLTTMMIAPRLPSAIRPLAILVTVPAAAVMLATLIQRFIEVPANAYGRTVRRRLVARHDGQRPAAKP